MKILINSKEPMIKEIKDYDEIEIPEILYKYRDWNDKWHKTILTNNELFLAPPESFEDKLDCRIPTRYDLLTDKEIFQKYYNGSIEKNKHFKRPQHRKFAKEWVKKGLMRNKEHIEQLKKEYWVKFNKSFGVLSLTANPINLKMWEKYSANHKGFCVGFDGRELLRDLDKFGGGGNVVYYSKLPIIHPLDDFTQQSMTNIYSKLDKWEFEEEYRTSKLNLSSDNDNWRKVNASSELYKQLILGAEIDDKDAKEIIEICEENYPEIKILKAEIKTNKIILNEVN